MGWPQAWPSRRAGRPLGRYASRSGRSGGGCSRAAPGPVRGPKLTKAVANPGDRPLGGQLALGVVAGHAWATASVQPAASPRGRAPPSRQALGPPSRREWPETLPCTPAALQWSRMILRMDTGGERLRRVGGIIRQGFTQVPRQYIRDLPAPKSVRIGDTTKKGWRGWKLLPGDEP